MQNGNQNRNVTNGRTGPSDQSKDEACKCCGKMGHTQLECYHKLKQCSICKVQGHISKACPHGSGQPTQAAKAATKPVVDKVPWICHLCGERNDDIHWKTCRACKKPQKKETLTADDPKNPMSPGTVNLLDQLGPDKVTEQQATLQNEKKDLERMIQDHKKHAHLQDAKVDHSFVTKAWHARLKQIEQLLAVSADQTATKVQKAMLGDNSRINHNFDQKLRKLEEDAEAVKARIDDLKLKQKAAIEAEEERHLKEIALLQDGFLNALKTADEELLEMKKKKEELEKQHKEDKAQITTTMAENTLPEVAANIEEKAVAKMGAAATEAMKQATQTEQQIAEVLQAADYGSAISPQTAGIAKLMKTMLDKQMEVFMNAMNDKKKEEAEEGDESEEDVLDVDDGQGDWILKSGRRRRRKKNEMLDDTTERRPATVRKAEGEQLSSVTIEEEPTQKKGGMPEAAL